MLGKFRTYSLRTQCLVIGIASAIIASTSGVIGGVGVGLLGNRIEQYRQSSDDTVLAQRIDATVTTALLKADRYLSGDAPQGAADVQGTIAAMADALDAAQSGTSPDVNRTLAQELAVPMRRLADGLERLLILTGERDRMIDGTLRVIGPQIVERASVIAAAGAAGPDLRLASLARLPGQEFIPVATAVEDSLATGSKAMAELAEKGFRALDDSIGQLSSYVAAPPGRAGLDLEPLRSLVAQYRDTFSRVQGVILEQGMAAGAIRESGDIARASVARVIEQARTSATANAATAGSTFATVAIALALSIAGALGFALVLSAAGARAMTGLIAESVGEMRKLAAGDAAIQAAAARRSDTLGDMGKALMALRDAILEKAALETRADEDRRLTEEQTRHSEDERRRIAEELARVVGSVSSAMHSLSQGDLTVRITDTVAERYVKLKEDFNFAVERLQETVSAAKAGTDSIRTGASEIALATDDLSRRTESQAANLEETAAAIHQITTTVQKTAEGAALARSVVSGAKTEAEKSGNVVRRAIDAMGAIEASSKQINQIIGVIDEIAFQTNLLALNAGVEAARAGDAGRGFAVVASEVRALAQRSADAARQIKDLISTSGAQVEEGVMLVEQTGRALEGIVDGVSEINTVVTAIAAGAQEQATGLQQVNTAVNQMDQVTQQNAAMVEEATAATRSLSQQTEDLVQLVGRFRTGDDTAARSTPAVGVFSRATSRHVNKVSPPRVEATPPRSLERPPIRMVANGTAAAATDAVSLEAADNWEEF